jgi:hypothetical protein
MKWFPLKTNNWWALDMRKFSYGNTKIAEYNFYDSAIAVIDTGSSLLGLPSKLYIEVFNMISVHLTKNNYEASCLASGICYIESPCDNIYHLFSNISFQIDNTLLTIAPQGYLLESADIFPDY